MEKGGTDMVSAFFAVRVSLITRRCIKRKKLLAILTNL